ncbi:ThiF family adenylyltransferase [Sphingobacterium bovistauri]|uniref:ThiF family adenylyltransferase n=1 Tax=Sphingobacterium bovistauri TaxID=2781959 RepID=A0ABS7Z6S9_9SPHI|nr:ThiF family adenylyltransferase [Sphingobacterium bovistauri]MCA5005312.1 ThiF family adenylyltransferase [Sphingobacterium bovistauri]
MINSLENKFLYKPIFFRNTNSEEKRLLEELMKGDDVAFVFDEIERQIAELIRCRFPMGVSDDKAEDLRKNILGDRNVNEFGVWVYYPWRKTVVHILDEQEFIEVRTNRNQLKISIEERQKLASKKIGIIGLSVGQSIALTIAMERICGGLRLADFDTLDLSNMNRLRTGLFNLSVPKVVISAREIAEIDPFLDVDIYPDGVDESNFDEFLNGRGGIDVLVEVCDSFEVKIKSRLHARKAKIPVVMDTNDRGMLDIERFDLEPNRPLLHGLADGLTEENLIHLSKEEKMGYLMKIVDAGNLSERMKMSIPEINRTLASWPQLASEVFLGGAITTTVCREILLGHSIKSGRHYMDVEKLIKSDK